MSDEQQLNKTLPSKMATRRLVTQAGLLTPVDVAKQLGLSIETLAQWRSQGRGIPFVKISRNCVRYRQSDLDCWLSERTVRTSQGPDDSGRRE